MRLRITMILAVLVVAAGLTATLLSHTGAATAGATVHARALTTTSTTNTPDSALPPIKHVFIIALENESAATTFPTSGTSPAPYLANTMVNEGAFLPNYYSTGHASNDNYISMISGQAPNTDNSDDCVVFGNFDSSANTGAPYYEQDGLGCVYPTDIPNIATQLDSAGLTWKSYDEDMGNDPSRESTECGHPAVGSVDHTQSEESGDAYATRHDPFVYFHNIIDNTALCDSHVVNLNELATDLQSSATTPNYVFITPNLCHDGHDATCKTPGENGGYQGIDDFLSKWVPMITNSPAFKEQNGLLITTFDEASTSDSSSCCGEIPGPGAARPGESGSGGGRVGAVLISPCIAPGTVSDVMYNHYAMLGSVENLFGLAHIGYAQLPGEHYFGSDIYTRNCDNAPTVALRAAALRSPSGGTTAVPLSFGTLQEGVTYTLQVRQLAGTGATAWQTLASGTTKRSYTYHAHAGLTYQFRLRASNALGMTSTYQTTTETIPTSDKPAVATLGGHWVNRYDPSSWHAHAELGSTGATYTYSYVGDALKLLATKGPAFGRVRITLDGVSRTVSAHAASHEGQKILYAAKAKTGAHTLKLTVLSGEFAVEGFIVSDLK